MLRRIDVDLIPYKAKQLQIEALTMDKDASAPSCKNIILSCYWPIFLTMEFIQIWKEFGKNKNGTSTVSEGLLIKKLLQKMQKDAIKMV